MFLHIAGRERNYGHRQYCQRSLCSYLQGKIRYEYMLYNYVDLDKQFIPFFILIFVLFLFLWNIDKEKLKRQCMWMNGPANVFPRSAELAILTMGMAAIIYQERPTNKQRWFHNGIILVVIELFMAVFFGFFRHLIGCDRENFFLFIPLSSLISLSMLWIS